MACAASVFPCRLLTAACRVQTAAAARTFSRRHFPRFGGTEDATTTHRLLCAREPSRWFACSTDAPVSPGAAAEAPSVSEGKPSQSSPAALKRLLKISLPGASRANAVDRNKSAAEPPQATTSAVTSEARETPNEAAVAQQQQQQQQGAAESNEWKEGENGTGEFGFKYKGPEPTKYGDWAHKGRVTDF
ncbi:hypothetical protein Emag_004683 [Eimeria magna]